MEVQNGDPEGEEVEAALSGKFIGRKNHSQQSQKEKGESEMATVGEKVRIAVLAGVHGLLDKVIDLNSVGAVKQYIRDLEGAVEKLEEASAVAGGREVTVRREVGVLRAQSEELDRNIDLLLSDNDPKNDSSAKVLETRLIGLEELLQSKTEDLTDAVQTASQLRQALADLEAKHIKMVQQVKRLESMDAAAKAKEQVAGTMKKVTQQIAGGAGISVDNVAAKIQERADVAEQKFQRAMGGVASETEKDVTLAEADARLAARRARLGKGLAAAAATATEYTVKVEPKS